MWTWTRPGRSAAATQRTRTRRANLHPHRTSRDHLARTFPVFWIGFSSITRKSKTMKNMLALITLGVIPAFSQQSNAPNVRPTPSGRVRPQLQSTVGIGNDIVTHIADGGSWKTSITLINLPQDKAATCALRFYSDGGIPQSFSFEGIGAAAT